MSEKTTILSSIIEQYIIEIILLGCRKADDNFISVTFHFNVFVFAGFVIE